jgi:enoyl-CoA hydratase
VRDVATKIASKGRLAVAQCKRVLFSGADVSLDVANALETQSFAMLFGTKDRSEGMKAFVEKRRAVFTGE